MKKILSVILALTFVLSMVPWQVSKALDYTEGYYTYTIAGAAPNVVATVIKYTGLDAVVVIPDTLGGYPVTAVKYRTEVSIIKGAFEGHEEITSITLPATLTSIGTDAFRACTGITEITLPDTLTSIGITSFYGCTGLLKINTGAATTLTSIGQEAFRNCTHITEITIPDSVETIGTSVFNGCTGIVNATIGAGITVIPVNAFAGCTGLTKVIIGKNVSTIELSAFQTCTGLKEIVVDAENVSFSTIDNGCVLFNKEQTKLFQYLVNETAGYTVPDGVTEIGTKAFENWTRLTSIVMPDSVEIIGISAFSGCTGIQSVIIPGGDYIENAVRYYFGVTDISEKTFYGCTGLKSVTFPSSVESIGTSAFSGCTALESVIIGSRVASIGTSAFSGCSAMTSLSLSDGVVSIGNSSFLNCIGLTEVTIPNYVTSIGTSAFSGCLKIVTLNIGSSVVGIGSSAFLGCKALLSVSVPDSVLTIGTSAFSGCTALTEATIGDGVKTIPEKLFNGCSALAVVTLGSGFNFIYFNAFNGTVLVELYIDENNPYFSSQDCVVFNKDKTILLHYLYSQLRSYTIPGSVLEIYEDAFYTCPQLTGITIPASVTKIGISAFYGCTGLSEVSIPNGVTVINDSVFYGCTGLTSVSFPNALASIGVSAFSGCSKLDGIIFPGTLVVINSKAFINCAALTTLVIPNSVTAIGSEAFSGCKLLASVTLSNILTNIADKTFNACSSLASITIPDSVTNIGASSFYGCSKLIAVKISNNATNIGANAFYNCVKLATLRIPNSVTLIGDNAFYGCIGLARVVLGSVVSDIGVSSFKGCTGLEYIVIPNSVSSIGNTAFQGCSKLKAAYFYGSAPLMGNTVFTGCASGFTVYYLNTASGFSNPWSGYPAATFTPITEIVITPSITVPTNRDVIVSIEYLLDADLREFKIDNGIWTNYTAPLAISANCTVWARCTDLLGNISSLVSLEITNIDQVAPEMPTLSATPLTPTGGNVTVTITFPAEAAVKEYKIGEGAWTAYTAPVILTDNATVSARCADTAGNISAVNSITVSNIDKTVPAPPSLSATPATPTNGNVTVTITYPVDALAPEYKIGDGNWAAYTVPVVLTENNTVYARYKNIFNNFSSTGSIVVSNIDTTAPAMPTFALNPVSPTNGNVTVTITYPADAAVKQYKIGAGTWTAYTAAVVLSANNTVYAKCSDAVGNNSAENSTVVSNIDRTAPVAPVFSADPALPTNGSVTVTITYPADAATKQYKIGTGAWSSYTAALVLTANNTVYAKCADAAGNAGSENSIIISNIDKTAPATPTLTAAPATATNGNVTVTISYPADAAVKEYKVGTGAWTLYISPVILSDNATVYARCSDTAGNTSATGSIVVSNIDKTAPAIPTLAANPVAPTNGNVTVTITYAADAAVKQYKIGTGSWTAYTAAVVLTANNTVYAKCSDALGNISAEGSIVVGNIDKTAPSAPAFSADPEVPTIGDVTVTITYPDDAVTKQYKIGTGAWSSYTAALVLTANNTVYAKCADAAGNVSSENTLVVTNIDKTAPATPTFAATPATPTNGNVTVAITYPADAAVKEYKVGDGGWTAYTSPVVLPENGTVYAICSDAAGNTSTTGSIVINFIDRSAPETPQISATPTEPTNGSVTVTINYPPDVAVKQYKINDGVWTAYSVPFGLTANCTVYAVCKDAAGNDSGTSSILVDNIATFVKIINDKGSDAGDTLAVKVPWYKSYKKITLQLGFNTNDSNYTKLEWLSDNSNVSIDANGFITNSKTGARSANITVKLTDSDGIVVTDIVKVIFYKFKSQLNRLQSQGVAGEINAQNNFVQSQAAPETVAESDTGVTEHAGLNATLPVLIEFMKNIMLLLKNGF